MTDEIQTSTNGGQDWVEQRKWIIEEMKHARDAADKLDSQMRALEQSQIRMEGTIDTGLQTIRTEVKDQALKRNTWAGGFGIVGGFIGSLFKGLA